MSRKKPWRKLGDEAIPWLRVERVIKYADEIAQTRSGRLPFALSYCVVCPIPEKYFSQKYGGVFEENVPGNHASVSGYSDQRSELR